MKGYITLVLNKTIGGGDGEIFCVSSSIVREKLMTQSVNKNGFHTFKMQEF